MVVVAEDWFEDGDIDDFSQYGIADFDDLLADGSMSIEDFPDNSERDQYWKEVKAGVAARGPIGSLSPGDPGYGRPLEELRLEALANPW
jgi:hypothetical protein